MRFSIPFKIYDPTNRDADEFDIDYDPEENSFDKLCDFMDEFPDKRINIRFPNGIDKKSAKSICRAANNGSVAFRLTKDDVPIAEYLRGIGAKFYFEHDVPAYNLVSLKYYLSLGVSDVYIVDDLWYNIESTREACSKAGVSIRLVGNRIPMMSPTRGTDPCSIIPRPNDYDLLDKYVDTIEFDCYTSSGGYNFVGAATLWKTWSKTKNWYGDLSEINEDLQMPVPNESLMPAFTRDKLRCGYKCATGGGCKKCQDLIDIAYSMDRKDWKFRKI